MLELLSIDGQKKVRIIVLDDSVLFCKELRELIENDLGYIMEETYEISEFRLKIQEAESQGNQYSIAIIDMNLSPDNSVVRRTGREALKFIKSKYPYIGCILASGIIPDDVLKLRDRYGLDSFISKSNITPETLEDEIRNTLKRVSSLEASKQKQISTAPQSNIDVTLDFHLQSDGISITWRSSFTGHERTRFIRPYDERQLPLVIRALDVLQYPHYPVPEISSEHQYFNFNLEEQQILSELGLWQKDRVSPQAARIVGQALFAALGTEGQRLSKALRNISSAQRYTINYVLRFPREGISLAALPWELSWDIERNQAVLIRGGLLDSCERYIDIDMAVPPPLRPGQRPHLLALIPIHHLPHDIREREQNVRLETWERLQQENKITYDEISPLTMRKLNNYLLKMPSRPDIIHFFGHGFYQDKQGYLVFDSEDGGRDLVSIDRLAAVLGNVRLVVIHACQSSMINDEGSLITGIGPALSMETGAVVAMQLTVRIESAIRFTEIFYNELLGKGRSLQDSVARVRQILYSEWGDESGWYVPTLYIRSRDQQPVYLIDSQSN